MNGRILLVEDEQLMARMLTDFLRKREFEVHHAATGREARELAGKHDFALGLFDQRLPDADGIELFDQIRELQPEMVTVFMTGHATIERAVEAMRKGAYDYIAKPLNLQELQITLERALDTRKMRKREAYTRYLEAERGRDHPLIGEAPAMQALRGEIGRAAEFPDANIFLVGETGSGKEVVARRIHATSPRGAGPFVALNCSALPESMVESELFGYEKGAFTGATGSKKGLFELASGGTLFLDEITEFPIQLQGKLLRAVETLSFYRLGSERPIEVDVRFVSATNRNVKEAVAEKHLREDLFYRLATTTVRVPPLRERADDLPALIEYFARRMRSQHELQMPGEGELKRMAEYPWPGNVRELKNVVERAMMHHELAHVSRFLVHEDSGVSPAAAGAPGGGKSAAEDGGIRPLADAVAQAERRHIERALEATGGNKTKAADLLSVSISTLKRRVKDLGIDG